MSKITDLTQSLRRLDQEASAGPWKADALIESGEETPVIYRDLPDQSLSAASVLFSADWGTPTDAQAIALLRNLAPNLAEMLETAERALGEAKGIMEKLLGCVRYASNALCNDPTFPKDHAVHFEGENLTSLGDSAINNATAALAELERLAGQQIK